MKGAGSVLRYVAFVAASMLAAVTCADTWSFSGRTSLPAVPEDEFRAQVRYAMATFDRYFTRGLREVPSGGQITIRVGSTRGPYAHTASYAGRGVIEFGGLVSAGANGPLRGVHADFIRRTVLHELFHHYIPSINFHTWQRQLTGNRVVDIGGSWATLTEYDGAMLVKYAGFRWRDDKRPWHASEDRWWIPRYAWTNPGNRYDVNADGRVTSIDALNVINAMNRGVRFDEFVQPSMYFDVNGDRSVSSLDAIAVINQLRNY